MASIATRARDQRVVHGSRRKGGYGRAVIFLVASITRKRSYRNVSIRLPFSGCAIVARRTSACRYCRVVHCTCDSEERRVIVRVSLGVTRVARRSSNHMPCRFTQCSHAIVASRTYTRRTSMSIGSPQESRVIGRVGFGVAQITGCRGNYMSRRLTLGNNAIMASRTYPR